MPFFRRVSTLLAEQIGLIILLCSALAWMHPSLFAWTVPHTSVFLAVIMFGMGLTISTEEFRAVLRRPAALFVGCAAQFTVMPLLAWGLAISYLARGDVALSVGMTVVSTLLAPLMTPFLVYALAGSRVEVSFWAMVWSVMNIVLIPFLAGLVLRRTAWGLVRRVAVFCPLVSVLGIVLIVGGIIAVNAEKIAESGLLVLLLVFLHNGAGLLLGLGLASLCGMNYAGRTSVAVEVGMQNSGLAVALATVHFASNPMATLPGAMFSAWQNISGALFAGWRRSRTETIPERD